MDTVGITIETTRLLIRDYKSDLSEIEEVFAFTGDPVVATHSSWGPLTREATAEVLRSANQSAVQNPRLIYQLAIVLRASNALIGHASLLINTSEMQEAKIGYTLHQDQWRRGYATETANALLHFGFNRLKLHRMCATTAPTNVASRRVLEKIGMRQEGLLRKNVLQRGKWRDSLLFACIEDDFQELYSSLYDGELDEFSGE